MQRCSFAFIAFAASCSPSADRVIKYKTNDNCPIALKYNRSFGDAKLESNEYSESEDCYIAVFDKKVRTIGDYAFLFCKFASITISASVESMPRNAVDGVKEVHITDLDAWRKLGITIKSSPFSSYDKDLNVYLNGQLLTE